MLCFAYAGIGQNTAGARFGIVTAVFCEHGLKFRRPDKIGIGGFRVGIDAVAFLHGAPQFAVALHHHVKHAFVFIGELVLIESAQPRARRQHHLPRARLEFTTQHLH